MHDGRGEGVRRPGRQLPVAPRRTPNYTSEALQRCRLTVQISTKLNRGHLITGEQALILPCLGPHRARRAGVGRAVRHRRGHDGRRPHVARRAAAGVASTCAASRPSSPASRAATLRRPHDASTGEALIDDYDRIREHIEHVVPGLRAVQRARPRAGRLLPAERPARGDVHDAVGTRAASPSTRSPSTTLARRASCC